MDKTLIILGAGASKDFCRIFPSGLELIKEINYHFLTEKKEPEVKEEEGIYLSAMMNEICRVFENNISLFKKIKNRLWDIQLSYEWNNLRNKSTDAISIDQFIASEINTGKLDISSTNIIKFAISYLIKGTEQALYEGSYNLNGNWIEALSSKLTINNIDTVIQNLKVITFNYDRLFEYYFIDYLKKYNPTLSSKQIVELENNIFHVYGSLGTLAEIPFKMHNDETSFLKTTFDRIKLIDDRNNIKLIIPEAEKFIEVHFIGFGYDRTNLEKLNLNQFVSASFSGTAYYHTDTQIEEIKSSYNINAKNISCNEYFKTLDV